MPLLHLGSKQVVFRMFNMYVWVIFVPCISYSFADVYCVCVCVCVFGWVVVCGCGCVCMWCGCVWCVCVCACMRVCVCDLDCILLIIFGNRKRWNRMQRLLGIGRNGRVCHLLCLFHLKAKSDSQHSLFDSLLCIPPHPISVLIIASSL